MQGLKNKSLFPKTIFLLVLVVVSFSSAIIYLQRSLVSALDIFKSHFLLKKFSFLRSLANVSVWIFELIVAENPFSLNPQLSQAKCLSILSFQCNFAVVQYGFEIRTEFDLRENWDPRATLQKVLDIVQVCNVTKTASAMQHVL